MSSKQERAVCIPSEPEYWRKDRDWKFDDPEASSNVLFVEGGEDLQLYKGQILVLRPTNNRVRGTSNAARYCYHEIVN